MAPRLKKGDEAVAGERTITDRIPLKAEDLTEDDRRSDEQQAEVDAFMLGVGPEGARIRIYRAVPTGGLAYCETVPKPVDVEEYISGQWGGGRYQVRLVGSKNEPLGSKSLAFEGAPKNPRETAVLAAPQAAAPGAISDVARLMIDMANKRADDMQAMMLKLLDGKQSGGSSGIGDVIAAVKDVMAMGQAVDPREQIKMVADAMTEGMKLGQDMKGGGSRKTEWADVVKDALPAIGEVSRAIAMTAQQQRGQPPQRRPAPPVTLANPPKPADASVVGTIPPAPGTEAAEMVAEPGPVDRSTVPPWLLQVEPYLPLLVNMAAFGMDPEASAAQIVAKLPDDVLDALEADCRVDGWVQRTLGVLPAQLSSAHAGWTTAVLTALQAQMLQPPEDDDFGEDAVP